MSLDRPLNGTADWTPAGPLTEMTAAEQDRRTVIESTIRRHFDAFLEVGALLVEMRDSRLYRSTHPTFAAYCADEWQMSRSWAYEVMAAAEVVSGIPDTSPRPSNPEQARALAAAPEAERADVMATVAAANDGKHPAKAITAEVEARHPKPAGAQPPPPRGPAPAPSPPPSADPPRSAEGDDPPAPTPVRAAVEPERRSEKSPSEKLWEPAKAVRKGLGSMPSVQEVMAALPADSLESFDHLADDAITWGTRWKEERKAATRPRLIGVNR